MKEFTEQLSFVAGVEFGDVFNCVWLGEYFTYEGEPYRDTVAHYEHLLAEVDELAIADTASSNEKRELRFRRKALVTSYPGKSKVAIKVEDSKTTSWKLVCVINV